MSKNQKRKIICSITLLLLASISNSFSKEKQFEIMPEENHVNYEKLYAFSYLKEANNPHLSPSLRNEVIKLATSYNTYPFDLPRDNVQKSTFCLRDKEGSRPQDLILDHELLEKACDSGHIIIEGNIDLLPLSLLPWGVFNLHFWGEGALQSLQSFNTVLGNWMQGSCTLCEGIDIAIPKVIDQKDELLDIVQSILRQSGLLKTLSIRFAGFTTEDCNQLFKTLKAYNHELQTLVLSFNDLDSGVLLESGCIVQSFNDFVSLPHLRCIDIRGNNFDGSLFSSDLANSIHERVLFSNASEEDKISFPFLRIGMSGIDDIISNDVGVINNEKYFPTEDKITEWEIKSYSETRIRDKFKRIFHHLESEIVLNNDYFIRYHDDQQLPYADLAEQLLMLRYGQMPIERVDLTSRLGFNHFSHLTYPRDVSFIFWLLSAHIKDPSFIYYYNIQEKENTFFHHLIVSFLKSTQIDEQKFHHCFS